MLGNTFLNDLLFALFFFGCSACRILPRPGIQSRPIAVKVPSPSRWTARELPYACPQWDVWGLSHMCPEIFQHLNGSEESCGKGVELSSQLNGLIQLWWTQGWSKNIPGVRPWRRLLRVLDSKEIKPVNPKGNQSWIFIGRTDAEAEAPILCPPDGNTWLIGKDPDAGKDWGWEEKGMTEDEMVAWHHWLDGHEFEQALELVKDREAWRAAVHEVAKSWIWLSDWTELRPWRK